MKWPSEAPVMTLPGATLFPQTLLPLYIFEPRYRRMLADMLHDTRMFSIAMQKPGFAREAPCHVACLGLIRLSVGHEDGTSHMLLEGLTRVELGSTLKYKPYRVHDIRLLKTASEDSVVIDALIAKVFELVSRRIEIAGLPQPYPMATSSVLPSSGMPGAGLPATIEETIRRLENLGGAEEVADVVASTFLSNPLQRQIILETLDLNQRLKHLIHFLLAEIQLLQKNENQ